MIGADLAVHTPLLVILGPTASGKSDLAMELARRANAEILSVDSMQVYREMDIGTAKPTSAERAAVPHHLIDVIDPNQEFTVARFVELADAVIRRPARPLPPPTGRPPADRPGRHPALLKGFVRGPIRSPARRWSYPRSPAPGA